MMKSMTAFGRARLEGEKKNITVELKSVNSRFFDCSVRLPRSYSFLEERIKEYIRRNATSRAKVEVGINVEQLSSSVGSVSVDIEYARSYLKALEALRDELSLRDDISVMTVARNQDIFTHTRPDEDLEAEWEYFRPVLDEAIAGYLRMRETEGARIEKDIREKIDLIRTYVDEIELISKEDNVGYRDKLEARLRQILGDNEIVIDESRILTECAIWADKIAIDEELVRLRSHFVAFTEMLESPEPAGRKLDFLMQELNRETNTIGSKANNARIARIVVSVKGELEKIREQIQNIE